MKCQEVMELMQRQLDDDLDEDEIKVLMDHTRHCPDCAAMFERLKLLSAELTSLPKIMPAYSLVDAIMPELERIDRMEREQTSESAVNHAKATRQAEARRVKPKRRWPSWSAISGVIAAGVVAGIFLVLNPPDIGQQAADKSGALTAQLYNAESSGDSNSAAARTKSMPGGDDSAIASDGETFTLEPLDMQDQSGGGHSEGAGSVQELHQTAQGGNANADKTPAEPEDSAVGSLGFTDRSNDDREIAGSPPGGGAGVSNADSYTIKGAISPNSRYDAYVDQHSIQIVDTDNGQIIMASPRKNGQHSQLEWSEDSSELAYEVQLQQGAIEKYIISTTSWTEKKASH